jgi:Predicted nucleic acid-binding protein, contains PIN domain
MAARSSSWQKQRGLSELNSEDVPADGPAVIVIDASVLINFLRIDRMDLLGSYSRNFLITDHVGEEIADHYPEQQARLRAALDRGWVEQQAITKPEELRLFGALMSEAKLGAGECAAIACAANRGYALAIDDRTAANRAARLCSGLKILGTQALMVSMILEGLIDVTEADGIKAEWSAKHRFHLKVGSFRDLLPVVPENPKR